MLMKTVDEAKLGGFVKRRIWIIYRKKEMILRTWSERNRMKFNNAKLFIRD